MKNLIIIVLGMLIGWQVKSQTYTLNVQESQAIWTGYGEIGSFKQEGSIQFRQGEILIKNDSIYGGSLVLSAKSIVHENKELSRHLRAKDFFYVKRYPEIRFTITKINGPLVTGYLEIRGKKREETFTFEIKEAQESYIVEGIASIDRTQYDIKYNSSSYFQDLGNYAIKNKFDLRFKITFDRKD